MDAALLFLERKKHFQIFEKARHALSLTSEVCENKEKLQAVTSQIRHILLLCITFTGTHDSVGV